ncbi:uncharacterized protein MCYG_08044 [Microsporum canis CBS 113480]|uniref:Uncharacterized protein n=1 Tax=Arthroderma otae (strain ATCC MYA-4605 / CBS 113480) TaxID=554155 RepID=C5FZC2_ARTOC|nr:uncharacterized protein MCYG_08044 [Microsporum canis CBS 113480]EEQ35225.1 predicted protein [Microsporum canis CBS 113480]
MPDTSASQNQSQSQAAKNSSGANPSSSSKPDPFCLSQYIKGTDDPWSVYNMTYSNSSDSSDSSTDKKMNPGGRERYRVKSYTSVTRGKKDEQREPASNMIGPSCPGHAAEHGLTRGTERDQGIITSSSKGFLGGRLGPVSNHVGPLLKPCTSACRSKSLSIASLFSPCTPWSQKDKSEKKKAKAQQDQKDEKEKKQKDERLSK